MCVFYNTENIVTVEIGFLKKKNNVFVYKIFCIFTYKMYHAAHIMHPFCVWYKNIYIRTTDKSMSVCLFR